MHHKEAVLVLTLFSIALLTQLAVGDYHHASVKSGERGTLESRNFPFNLFDARENILLTDIGERFSDASLFFGPAETGIVNFFSPPPFRANPALISQALTQQPAFGAESNPTGSSIGGGYAYHDIVTPTDSAVNYTVTTADELLTALQSAGQGDVVYIDEMANINLTDTPEVVIPAGVTLASNRGARSTVGSAVYSFNIGKQGDYVLWGLASAPQENGKSFWVSVDGEESRHWNLERGSNWSWNREGSHNLSSGQHTLVIRWRENESKLDRLFITADSGLVPDAAIKEHAEGDRIWLEAESGVTSSPMRKISDPTASGGMCISVLESSRMDETPISPGGRIFLMRANNSRYPTALIAGGENIRITGIRLEGPDITTESVNPPALGIYASYRMEVDNCEIWGWSGAGIGVYRTGGGSDMKSGGYFHHNNIHHCQMNGLGYGIIVANGSVSLIEANYFDYCRHAIAGDGHVENGYEVRYNVFGYNFPESNNAHRIDMHGVSTASGNVAGDRLIIHHNTFEAISTTDYCIAIRGIPRTGAYIDHNWIKYTGDPIGRTGVTTSQLNTRMYIGENKGPNGQILSTLSQRIISTSLS